MKKKVAVRKLNRTLLKKEGTKEVYITGKNVLMPFFDYKNIEDLATSRKEDASKRPFIYKKRMNGSNEANMTLSVTRENNEVRLTGFEDFFNKNGINEVDQIVLECTQTGDDKQYFLDYVRCTSTRVLQSYEPKDSCENYIITGIVGSARDNIQFSVRQDPIVKHDGTYWLWDDAFDENRWNELIGRNIEVTFIARGKVRKKTIQILKTGEKIKKIMKARSSSSNQIEYQEKELYEIIELIDGRWVAAGFDGIKNLELVDEGSRIKISNRDAMSFCLYEGGELS